MKDEVGLYVPSDDEIDDCISGKSCDFGICSECSEGYVEKEYSYNE